MKWCVRMLIAAAFVLLFVGSAVKFSRAPNPVTHGKPVSLWAAQLLSSDYQLRNEAAEVLRMFGEGAVPQLEVLIRRRERGWEKQAAKIVGRLEYLKFKVPDAALSRERAAEVLAEMGAKAAPAADDLVSALGEVGGRESVKRALRCIGSEAERELRKGLEESKPAVRVACAELLGELGSVLPETEQSLIRGLQAVNVDEKLGCVVALGRLRTKGAEAGLVELLEKEEWRVREKAAEALGQLRSVAKETFERLGELARNDKSLAVRFEAAKAQWRLGAACELVVAELVPLLESGEAWKAAYLLGQFGERAEAALPGLIQQLEREQVPRAFRTPPSAAVAIGQIGPAALPLLEPLLGREETRVRLFAVMSIGFMGRAGRAGEELVVGCLKDEAAEVRHAAAMSLASIGARGERVIAGLVACLGAEDIFMRSMAADRLKEIAPEREWFALSE